jgi:hypothetical protein
MQRSAHTTTSSASTKTSIIRSTSIEDNAKGVAGGIRLETRARIGCLSCDLEGRQRDVKDDRQHELSQCQRNVGMESYRKHDSDWAVPTCARDLTELGQTGMATLVFNITSPPGACQGPALPFDNTIGQGGSLYRSANFHISLLIWM